MAQAPQAELWPKPHIWARTTDHQTSRRSPPGREAYVVTALRRKLAELKGLAAYGDTAATEAIKHVAATLLLFKRDEDVSAVPALPP